MIKKISLFLLTLILIPITTVFALEPAEVDEMCSDRLEGTMSVESCLAECAMAGYVCGLAAKFDEDKEDGLEEDLTCYGCRKEICADYGSLDATQKANCDADPDKKSIKAPPLKDGTPCWFCVDKKDQCSDKWPGSTVKATCKAACPKGTHQCVKVGKYAGENCFQCVAIVPPPPPPPRCSDWGLKIAAQCGACRDPKPLCVPTGAVASNGPCFDCVEKPKIKCSDYGYQDKCKCAKDETVKYHWVTKVGALGVKVRKKCCECVKKPDQCMDINLYTESECKKACKKPGTCKKTAKTKKGIPCYDCVSPITCEESGYESTCAPCKAAGKDCVDVTTVDGVKCKECVERKIDDSVMVCPDQGLPGMCPGTCKRGQLCIPRRGPCHICMTVKRIEITWVIIIIETPYGRIVLDEYPNMDQEVMEGFRPTSIMALAQYDPSMGDFESLGIGQKARGSVSEIAETLKKRLELKRPGYSQDCFSEFDQRDVQNLPPSSSSSFGQTDRDDFQVTGPVLVGGTVDGKAHLFIYDASGALVGSVNQKELKDNAGVIEELLTKAADRSVEYVSTTRNQTLDSIKVSSRETDASRELFVPKKKKKKKDEVIFDPNDPYFYKPKQKKKKLLGVFGSSKTATVKMGLSGKMLGNRASGSVGGVAVQSIEKRESDTEDQWGIREVGYLPKSDPNSAWNIVDGRRKNVLVAVIDSGFDETHPDAPKYVWVNKDEIPNNGKDDDQNGYVDDVNGWNFLDNNDNLRDLKGHGTFTAGIIAARTNNGIGIAGINPGAIIMPLKVANKVGETNSVNIFRAITYAVDNGARVINISMGGRGVSRLEQAAITYAHSKGVFVSVASGNVGERIGIHGPAAARYAYAVGSVDMTGERSTISNWGPNNGILAPGEDIYSLIAEDNREMKKSIHKLGYYVQSGTSFSTPIVSATASLLLAQDSNLTNQHIEDILSQTATEMYEPGWDAMSGSGFLNASVALDLGVKLTISPTIKITETTVNRDRKEKVTSVDVFGIVQGHFNEYTVELGKGKNARKFKTVAGPFKDKAYHSWLARIDQKQHLRGSRDWVVRIKVVDSYGEEHIAQAPLSLNR